MAKTTNLNIRINPVVKTRAEKLYAQFGITITDAVNMFIHQSLLEDGIPFRLKARTLNEEPLMAMAEAKQLARDPKAKTYASFSDILEEIEEEDENEVLNRLDN